MSPQAATLDPLDALAAQHGAITSAPASAQSVSSDPLDQLARQHGSSAATSASTTQPDYGYGARWNEQAQAYAGPPKGLGHLGPLLRPDGNVMSEYSIDTQIDGKNVQIPTIVPTLTRKQLDAMLSLKEGDPLPAGVQQAAITYARKRIADGKDPFAGAGEQQDLYSDVKRAPIPRELHAPDFAATNAKTSSGDAEVDPNSLGTLARHLWAGVNPLQLGQLLPWPKAAGGSGMDNPLFPSNVAKSLGEVKKQADAALAKGDYRTAIAKYVESVIPLVGPMMAKQGDEWSSGHYAAALGDSAAMAVNVAEGEAAKAALSDALPLATHPAAAATRRMAPPEIQFAQRRGIPIDAATATDNLAVKGVQTLSDWSPGGSMVATPANAARAEAMTRVGGELADEAHPTPATPEQAGQSVRDALRQKMAGHAQEATAAYDAIRTLEEQPQNRMEMPLAPKSVDALTDGIRGQLRRIVHELDAAPYTPRLLKPTEYGGSLEHVPGTGGAGAKVFDDIVANMSEGANPTRGVVQSQLETYLAGGPETPTVRAALDVAKARISAPRSVSGPELPPSAMSVPTKLEAGRVTSENMGFPVLLPDVKEALRPLYEQMRRQMPITQQQANPGLKAIENILTGPDYAPLSQVDRDLSAIKAVARDHGGLAKVAVSKLDAAVQQAAQNGGPPVVQALRQGRQATIAKYATSDVLDTLHDEPVRVARALTAPKDSAIQSLRAVTKEVPAQAPVIARAYLEDLLEKPQKVSEWKKLGSETKAILFPKPGLAEALDNFFALTERMSKTNVNPSGTAYVSSLMAHGAVLWNDPAWGIPLEIGSATLSKLLRSPTVVNALSRGMTLSVKTPAAVQAAATLNLVKAAQAAGVPLVLPKAAGPGPSQ